MAFDRITVPPFSRRDLFDPRELVAYRGGGFIEYIFTTPVAAVIQPRIVGGELSGEVTSQDRIYDRYNESTFYGDGFMFVDFLDNSTTNYTWTSSDNTVLQMSPNGEFSALQNGTVSATLRLPDAIYSQNQQSLVTQYAEHDEFNRFVNGSFGQSASTGVDNRISGKSATASKALYTTQDHSTPTYVRNTGFWAADIDLTCISPWNSYSANKRTATLISPIHAIWTCHYDIPIGTTIRYVKSDNTVVDKTLIDKIRHPDYSIGAGISADVCVGILDSPVSGDGISFAQVLPTGDALSGVLPNFVSDVPLMVLDQEEKGLIYDWYREYTQYSYFNAIKPSNTDRISFWEQVIVGDSSNPVFLVVTGSLILCTTLTSASTNSIGGMSYRYYHDDIQSFMNTLSSRNSKTQYNLVQADLSTFNQY